MSLHDEKLAEFKRVHGREATAEELFNYVKGAGLLKPDRSEREAYERALKEIHEDVEHAEFLRGLDERPS